MSLDATLFFCFGDVIGVEQVWSLSINLQSNKVIVLGQISLNITPLVHNQEEQKEESNQVYTKWNAVFRTIMGIAYTQC
jgi:hypothetical protein